jgi:hypothetical protein
MITKDAVPSGGIEPGGDREVYWDMPGFGLMVTKTRSFVFQYRNALHQSRRTTWTARIDGRAAIPALLYVVTQVGAAAWIDCGRA